MATGSSIFGLSTSLSSSFARFGVLGERGDVKDLDLCTRTLHPADTRTDRPADQLSERFFFFGASVPGFPEPFVGVRPWPGRADRFRRQPA